ncbi:hypothetical protein SDRG_12206 [Saprolegnia diclina VS20]|uniref:Uncharacterized protein n=1 Tax=Saprolegnia diclina (strain VS20) TaxID=1156394 RepID=T0RD30_SAPDV|nr:hypothetical protein SDRG_12206 [Saprolegnia diclina VS20]EQC30148.1 hypothetical protein SDRG_12206 [Saprolegnia diclina VS20]|eukprot:XP_008616491.1 hypothetical protein SDRG_12206 [Saprolegnia diclina VS20]
MTTSWQNCLPREEKLTAARDHVCLRNTAGQAAKDLATAGAKLLLDKFLQSIEEQLEPIRRLLEEARLVEAVAAKKLADVKKLLNEGAAVTEDGVMVRRYGVRLSAQTTRN